VAICETSGEVARVQADLRRTSEQLLSAQEDERERIAVELHDSTGQHLAALGLGVARLRRLVGARRGVGEVLDEMSEALQEAHREIRVLSYLLKPPSALEGGLGTTVRRFVKGFGNRTGLHTSFRAEGESGAMIAGAEHAALRVVQEALSNVYRHAEATGVEVELITRDGLLTIRVADDGRGIESVRNRDFDGIPLGVGIAGMRSRVEQFGGGLDIMCDCTGTVVTASIPIRSEPIGSPVIPRPPSKETPNGSGLPGL
jgi:signal transduction histidine kinase